MQGVHEKAPVIHEQFRATEARVEAFQALSLKVRDVTESATRLGPVDLASRLRELADEAATLQLDAHGANLKTLEKNAQNLGKSLRAMAGKLGNFSSPAVALEAFQAHAETSPPAPPDPR